MEKFKTIEYKRFDKKLGKEVITNYVPVNERLKYFRANYPNWSLESWIESNENDTVVIRSCVKDDKGRTIATGYASETKGKGMANENSHIENCETSSWGRCLGCLGIGIEESIASAEEVQGVEKNLERTAKDLLTTAVSKFESSETVFEKIGLTRKEVNDIWKSGKDEDYQKLIDLLTELELEIK